MFFTDMCCGRVNVLYRHVLWEGECSLQTCAVGG